MTRTRFALAVAVAALVACDLGERAGDYSSAWCSKFCGPTPEHSDCSSVCVFDGGTGGGTGGGVSDGGTGGGTGGGGTGGGGTGGGGTGGGGTGGGGTGGGGTDGGGTGGGGTGGGSGGGTGGGSGGGGGGGGGLLFSGVNYELSSASADVRAGVCHDFSVRHRSAQQPLLVTIGVAPTQSVLFDGPGCAGSPATTLVKMVNTSGAPFSMLVTDFGPVFLTARELMTVDVTAELAVTAQAFIDMPDVPLDGGSLGTGICEPFTVTGVLPDGGVTRPQPDGGAFSVSGTVSIYAASGMCLGSTISAADLRTARSYRLEFAVPTRSAHSLSASGPYLRPFTRLFTGTVPMAPVSTYGSLTGEFCDPAMLVTCDATLAPGRPCVGSVCQPPWSP